MIPHRPLHTPPRQDERGRPAAVTGLPCVAEAVVARIERLPPLPRVVHELQLALRDDARPTTAIVQLVASDPALTAAAVRLANSPFYGVAGRVGSLRDAVQILGLRTLSSAVLTVAVMARFDASACPHFDFEACWRHALSSAVCAQTIAQARGLDECLAYTCGLLHDLGTLALVSLFPAEFDASVQLQRQLGLAPAEAERRVLGIDHAAAGAALASHWGFAPALVEAIRQHHEVPDGRADPLLDVLHFADNVTHALDLSQGQDDMVPPLSLATWDRLGLGGDELQRLFGQIESRVRDLGLSVSGR